MKTAYIFHDSFAEPFTDWYPWMKTMLESMGYVVVVPAFPTPAGQSLESWRTAVKNYRDKFDEDTIVIGHGTGGIFALRMIQESERQIHGLFIVAGYAEKIGHAGFDRVNETFLVDPFSWETIKSRALVIDVFAGENDPFVPAAASQHVADQLGVPLQTIPDGGHINRASGFVQAVPVLQGIKESLTALTKTIETTTEPTLSQSIQMPTGTAGIDLQSLTPTTMPENIPTPDLIETPNTAPGNPTLVANEAHTMYQDMSRLVNSNQGSVASSLLEKAREDDAVKKSTSPTNPTNILYTTLSVVVLVVAAGLIFYGLQQFIPAFGTAPKPEIPSLIQAESHQKIDIVNRESYTIEQSIRAALAPEPADDTIGDLYYASNGTFASLPQTFAALGIGNLPESLSQQFAGSSSRIAAKQPLFMHGNASYQGSRGHFLVIPIENYDVAFRGLRDWEQTMYRDTGLFMNVSALFLKTKFSKDTFEDTMVSNRPLRILRYRVPNEPTFTETVQVEPAPNSGTSSESSSESAPANNPTNFISEGLETVQNVSQSIASPYREGDIMLAYFFLNEHAVVIVDNPSIIPLILKRYANRQIYN